MCGEFLDLERCDQGGSVGQDGHQAFGDQARQGVAHRRAGQAELCGQRHFVQLYAGLELQREDLPTQFLVDVAAAMAPSAAFGFLLFAHHQVSVFADCVIQTSPSS